MFEPENRKARRCQWTFLCSSPKTEKREGASGPFYVRAENRKARGSSGPFYVRARKQES